MDNLQEEKEFYDFQEKYSKEITKEYFKRYGKCDENKIRRIEWENIASELFDEYKKENK